MEEETERKKEIEGGKEGIAEREKGRNRRHFQELVHRFDLGNDAQGIRRHHDGRFDLIRAGFGDECIEKFKVAVVCFL